MKKLEQKAIYKKIQMQQSSDLAVKEGVKKAQYFATINKLGGLQYFSCCVDVPAGDPNLLMNVLQGINKEKAKNWGKVIVSANDTLVSGIVHVPQKLAEETKLNAPNWANYIVRNTLQAEILDENDELVKFEIRINPFDELFTFKLCDEVLKNSTNKLKICNLLPKNDDSSDNEFINDYEW